jgi:hypothetical protein
MSIIMENHKTSLSFQIEQFEKDTLLFFKPSKHFYKEVGINQKRFWQLVKGMAKPLTEETQNLAKYFKVPVTDLMQTI